jgi:large subunit ribosomal protein L7Ae
VSITQGKARLGWLIHRKMGTTAAFAQANLQDKGAVAELAERGYQDQSQ